MDKLEYRVYCKEWQYGYRNKHDNGITSDFLTIVFDALNWPYKFVGHWTGSEVEFYVPKRFTDR